MGNDLINYCNGYGLDSSKKRNFLQHSITGLPVSAYNIFLIHRVTWPLANKSALQYRTVVSFKC